jgi:hypothetical protein
MKMEVKKAIEGYKKQNGFTGKETLGDLQWYQMKMIEDQKQALERMSDKNDEAHEKIINSIAGKTVVAEIKTDVGKKVEKETCKTDMQKMEKLFWKVISVVGAINLTLFGVIIFLIETKLKSGG